VKADDYEEEIESSEQLVIRIRDELKASEDVRATDLVRAQRHDDRARELLQKLFARQEAAIEKIARHFTTGIPRLYEDAISQISLELTKAIRALKRPGPATMFDRTLRGIAYDAYRKLKSQNKGAEGITTDVQDHDETKTFRFVSADAKRPGPEGAVIGTIAEAALDPEAYEAFERMLGAAAYEQISGLLPERQKAVMDFSLEGLPDVQIAERLGIHPDTVASDYKKALATTKRHYARQREENS